MTKRNLPSRHQIEGWLAPLANRAFPSMDEARVAIFSALEAQGVELSVDEVAMAMMSKQAGEPIACALMSIVGDGPRGRASAGLFVHRRELAADRLEDATAFFHALGNPVLFPVRIGGEASKPGGSSAVAEEDAFALERRRLERERIVGQGGGPGDQKSTAVLYGAILIAGLVALAAWKLL